ncbi:hypothetical protein vseg_009084 [Gypsophila vaccaria]
MSLRFIAKLKPSKHAPHNIRQMTSHRRVGDRSKKKRVHHLEIVTEKWKIFSKIHLLLEVIKSEPEHVIPIQNLNHYRRQINLPKPHRISDFLKKSPEIFDFYKDCQGILWVGMTDKAEELLDEEERLLELYSDKAAEYVTRCLMMSIDKRLKVDKIAHFRRDFGLPLDFRKDWVHRFPSLFRVVKCEGDNENEYLELVEWKNEWAVTELERRISNLCGDDVHSCSPGKLSLAFPMKFPPNFKDVYKFRGKLEQFQMREYFSPYADARELVAGSYEFDKRAVAVMHELLSFTLEKRLVTDHLTHFRREMVMPQKLMRLLLKHFGIFYVSERGKRFHVFLNEAYEGSELVEKSPLVLWREKVHSLIGYRGKRQKAATFEEFSDVEDKNLWNSESEDEGSEMDLQQENTICVLADDLLENESEMDIDEVSTAYKDG